MEDGPDTHTTIHLLTEKKKNETSRENEEKNKKKKTRKDAGQRKIEREDERKRKTQKACEEEKSKQGAFCELSKGKRGKKEVKIRRKFKKAESAGPESISDTDL